jgi:hypothetical protein
MYTFENYIGEDLLNEDLLNEDLLNEDLLESFDESFDESRRLGRRSFAPIRPGVRPRVAQQSNFGKSLSGNAADYATKSDLKKALDSISNDVNELKKTTIATTKSIKALDAKHTELAKIDARKNENHKAVLKNMQMMNMVGSLLNQPKLKPENLKYDEATNKITEITPGSSIHVDQTMSLLLPMLTTMGESGSGKSDNSNMMLPLILIATQNKDNSSNNTMLPLVLMMTMMNK